MSTSTQVLNIARSQIGYVEGPNNNTKYGLYTGYNNQPWCGSFIDWLFNQAGMTNEPSCVWTPSGQIGYKSKNRFLDRNSSEIKAGDIVFFDWSGTENNNSVDHVGIVEEVLPNNQIQTIEGNTSSNNQGSQSNGGGVFRKIRNLSTVSGFGRPLYQKKTLV